MTVLKLKKMNEGGSVIYKYYPNGEQDFGEIEYQLETKECRVLFKAVTDETGHFARESVKKIKKTLDSSKSLPIRFIQASY